VSTPDRAPGSVVVCFLLSAVGAAGFAASYVLGLGNEALGATIGAAFAFLALGLARWSSLIDAAEPDYVEERAVGPTPEPEYDAFRAALTEQPVPRSWVLWGALGTAVAAIGGAALFPLRSLMPAMGTDPDDVLERTPWKAGLRLVTEEGTAIRATDLDVGGTVTAFPEGLDPRKHVDTTTVLVRVDPADLRLPADRADWVVDGVVAYSKLCTHAGCPVGLYTDTSRQLLCPCHHSIFDVTDGAKPVEGPAPHPLPQLPLGTDESGYLVARGDFSGPVGPAWGNH
jgi:ubiquinol-cytochrome c reductase iron-sulfur subunit